MGLPGTVPLKSPLFRLPGAVRSQPAWGFAAISQGSVRSGAAFINQSRCGSGIPRSRHHVSPAGHPRRGALRGPRGRRGGVSAFPQLRPGAAGKEEELQLHAPRSGPGVSPRPGQHLHPGLASVAPSFIALKDLSGDLGSDGTTQALFIYKNWRTCPPSRASCERPGTHRCSARSQREGWCQAGRRRPPGSSISRI